MQKKRNRGGEMKKEKGKKRRKKRERKGQKLISVIQPCLKLPVFPGFSFLV